MVHRVRKSGTQLNQLSMPTLQDASSMSNLFFCYCYFAYFWEDTDHSATTEKQHLKTVSSRDTRNTWDIDGAADDIGLMDKHRTRPGRCVWNTPLGAVILQLAESLGVFRCCYYLFDWGKDAKCSLQKLDLCLQTHLLLLLYLHARYHTLQQPTVCSSQLAMPSLFSCLCSCCSLPRISLPSPCKPEELLITSMLISSLNYLYTWYSLCLHLHWSQLQFQGFMPVRPWNPCKWHPIYRRRPINLLIFFKFNLIIQLSYNTWNYFHDSSLNNLKYLERLGNLSKYMSDCLPKFLLEKKR